MGLDENTGIRDERSDVDVYTRVRGRYSRGKSVVLNRKTDHGDGGFELTSIVCLTVDYYLVWSKGG